MDWNTLYEKAFAFEKLELWEFMTDFAGRISERILPQVRISGKDFHLRTGTKKRTLQ